MNTIIILTCIGVLAMLAEIFRIRKALYPMVLAGLAIATGATLAGWGATQEYFRNMIVFDNYAVAFSTLLCAVTLLWYILASGFLRGKSHEADYSSLIIFSLAGSVVMVSFADLTMFFIGIEILSIAMYVLAASGKSEFRSNEAGFKYFLLGAFATGFLLFGIALIYGVTGTFNLAGIASYVSAHAVDAPMLLKAGIILIIVGLAFKVSVVPFHFWAPDVYEGAPTAVTAYMSTVVKTAAFAAFLRLFMDGFMPLASWWVPLLAVCAAMTMILGNILAVGQQSLKRMMAYSSIAHAGYMLMALVAVNEFSKGALFLYGAAYAAGSLGIFSLVMVMTAARNESVASLSGFSSVNKVAAVLLSVILLSLAGIPPVAGFFAKYYLFTGTLASGYTWLVLLAVVSSLIGVYYYLRVVIQMYLPATRESVQYELTGGVKIALWLCAIITLLLGIFPGPMIGLF